MTATSSRALHRYTVGLAALTFLLLIAGAAVTSNRAGLAVPDWPTTYGEFMFSYPYAKWVGGIFYEHGHRVLASIVGLLTIGLAFGLVAREPRRWVRRLGIVALGTVILQGLLGGLTVKYQLPPAISIAHAGLAEAFFCLLITLAVATGRRWQEPPLVTPHARSLQRLATVTTGLVYLQILLGATVRHAELLLIPHIIGAILVLMVAGLTAVATPLAAGGRRDFLWVAGILAALMVLQLGAGLVTLLVRVPKTVATPLTAAQVVWPTVHLALGALLLAGCWVLTLKSWRSLRLPETTAAGGGRARGAMVELGKPRIVALVLVTTTLAYFLADHGLQPVGRWLATLFGVGAATAGAAMLNNYLERETDRLMQRTCARALPAGLVRPETVLATGVLFVLGGAFWLVWRVNLLTGFLALLAAFLYVLVYTPLKKLTWLNTSVGAIPGALPPLCGWAAATGQLDAGAWALFAILFAWQHPHFFSIAWLYREDYRRAGFQMLPVVEPTGRRLWRLTLLFSALLIAASLAPVALGLAGWVYGAGAVLLGLALLAAGVTVFADARRLLRASVVYLPLLLALIFWDARAP